jgi:hypothetical protein
MMLNVLQVLSTLDFSSKSNIKEAEVSAHVIYRTISRKLKNMEPRDLTSRPPVLDLITLLTLATRLENEISIMSNPLNNNK